MNIKRFSVIDRLFHLFVMLTFLTMAATGFGRVFVVTDWGRGLCSLFGGYEACGSIHRWVGISMIVAFFVHIVYVFAKIQWRNLKQSIFGPDSLVPNLQDLRHIGKRILWSFGIGSPPELDRWTYWEKFDYWAVFWGMPLLAITGLMMMYPMETCLFVPGWVLNLAAFLHKAEAILAVTFIFTVHFFVQHLRPSSFPLNQAMFSGSVPMEEASSEKPAWIARLESEGKLEQATVVAPSLPFRVAYLIFGYSVMGVGVYLLINGIVYSRYVTLH
ncbi:MAG: cytochrome b/b6 domain-containing protein [Thermodesulfobacteriota bacterium]